MSELAEIFKDSVGRMFLEQVNRDFLREQETGGWPEKLWTLIEELGITDILISEENEGVGGDWMDAYEIVRACGIFAVPLPVPETLVGRWLLEQNELEQIRGPITLVADARHTQKIPWARNAAAACLIRQLGDHSELICVDLTDIEIKHGVNLANEPRDGFSLEGINLQGTKVNLPKHALLYLGALLRAAQIAGVATALLEHSASYVSERSQFGRPLVKFQVIQHNLARLASVAASLDAISRSAFKVMNDIGFQDDPSSDVRFTIAAAKQQTSNSVEQICSIAHQLHGAIGFTYEHELHFFSRRAWSWRSEFGNNSYWAAQLGKTAIESRSEKTWQLVTSVGSPSQI